MREPEDYKIFEVIGRALESIHPGRVLAREEQGDFLVFPEDDPDKSDTGMFTTTTVTLTPQESDENSHIYQVEVFLLFPLICGLPKQEDILKLIGLTKRRVQPPWYTLDRRTGRLGVYDHFWIVDDFNPRTLEKCLKACGDFMRKHRNMFLRYLVCGKDLEKMESQQFERFLLSDEARERVEDRMAGCKRKLLEAYREKGIYCKGE